MKCRPESNRISNTKQNKYVYIYMYYIVYPWTPWERHININTNIDIHINTIPGHPWKGKY